MRAVPMKISETRPGRSDRQIFRPVACRRNFSCRSGWSRFSSDGHDDMPSRTSLLTKLRESLSCAPQSQRRRPRQHKQWNFTNIEISKLTFSSDIVRMCDDCRTSHLHATAHQPQEREAPSLPHQAPRGLVPGGSRRPIRTRETGESLSLKPADHFVHLLPPVQHAQTRGGWLWNLCARL